MNTRQSPEQHLASLKKQIEDMEPLERVCSHVTLVLGRCIAELLNRHDYVPIESMEQVCVDIFKQAKLARDQMKDTIQ